MEYTQYIQLTKALRIAHLDLASPCEFGDPMTGRKLARLFDISNAPDEVANLCGNPQCANPRHYYFARSSEKRWVHGTSGRNRIKAVLARPGTEALSQIQLAEMAGVTRNMLRRYLKEEAIPRPTVRGAKHQMFFTHSQAAEAKLLVGLNSLLNLAEEAGHEEQLRSFIKSLEGR
jgi:hypothetical protein